MTTPDLLCPTSVGREAEWERVVGALDAVGGSGGLAVAVVGEDHVLVLPRRWVATRRWCQAEAAGRVTVKTAPPPAALAAWRRPPLAAASSAAMARPTPEPSVPGEADPR